MDSCSYKHELKLAVIWRVFIFYSLSVFEARGYFYHRMATNGNKRKCDFFIEWCNGYRLRSNSFKYLMSYIYILHMCVNGVVCHMFLLKLFVFIVIFTLLAEMIRSRGSSMDACSVVISIHLMYVKRVVCHIFFYYCYYYYYYYNYYYIIIIIIIIIIVIVILIMICMMLTEIIMKFHSECELVALWKLKLQFFYLVCLYVCR